MHRHVLVKHGLGDISVEREISDFICHAIRNAVYAETKKTCRIMAELCSWRNVTSLVRIIIVVQDHYLPPSKTCLLSNWKNVAFFCIEIWHGSTQCLDFVYFVIWMMPSCQWRNLYLADQEKHSWFHIIGHLLLLKTCLLNEKNLVCFCVKCDTFR